MKTILVTGGTGFLGRRAAAYLEARGFQVLTPSHKELDITKAPAVRAWFRENRPDVVIHTAAISDTGKCQRQPEWSAAVNVDGCIHLAESIRKSGGRLLICSSDQVYSGSSLPGPHREEEPVTPSNVYGNQKRLAEQRCLEILPDTVCLRLSWMYSTESFPGEHGHFLTTLTAALADEKLPLTWPVHDFRGLTDVDTVIRNLPGAWNLPGGIYNFGSENNSSTYETVKQLLTQLGMASALTRLIPNEEAFAEKPRNISMDLSRLRSAGITFPTSLEGLLSALKKEKLI